jgi:hypothetical protein
MVAMNLPLEPDELNRLIELAHLGEWLVNSQHDHDFQDDAATGVTQKLLAASKAPGVEQDPETGNYYLAPEWSDRLYDQYITDYDDHVFWAELTERLAQRDLAKHRGVAMDDINRDEDIRQLRLLEERYRSEFEERGVDRLDVTDDF